MEYTAADVKKLREQTGATFADCKNALAEAKSWEEANKIIEARSEKKAEKMMAAGRRPNKAVSFPMSIIIIALVSCSNSIAALIL